ncbi:hypothetical protein C2G38_2035433 [Gigaspora rosea]|uniref:Uncharacterized protein n=1 Tax=Gigaspora rosea TaxID=44941 RepID=A0A397VJY0_9GLOM|nr:hypothetical protein C2G38_2035433 [Gigaspora rosea]
MGNTKIENEAPRNYFEYGNIRHNQKTSACDIVFDESHKKVNNIFSFSCNEIVTNKTNIALEFGWESVFQNNIVMVQSSDSLRACLLHAYVSSTTRKWKSKQISEKENIIKEFQTLIKDQTIAIIEAIDNQHTHTMKIQQKQHDEQIEIFKQFLLKF